MNRYQKKSQEGNPLAALSSVAYSWPPIPLAPILLNSSRLLRKLNPTQIVTNNRMEATDWTLDGSCDPLTNSNQAFKEIKQKQVCVSIMAARDDRNGLRVNTAVKPIGNFSELVRHRNISTDKGSQVCRVMESHLKKLSVTRFVFRAVSK